MAKADLTAQRLRELLHYDPETDTWTRIASKMRPDRVGKTISSVDENGYLRTRVDGKKYRMHRLVWLWHNGSLPINHIDHIDGNIKNNKIANLRDVGRDINAQNQRGLHSNNSSGFAGVHKTPCGRFMSRISIGGRSIFLGRFDNAEDASSAYIEAKRNIHPGCTI